MLKTNLFIGKIEILKLFVSASYDSDMSVIEDLLDVDGVFEIEDSNNVLVDSNKAQFLSWYQVKLHETKIKEVVYDQCIGCSFANQVVIFNNGTFPRVPQDFTDKTKAGLMMEILGDKISKIQFCNSFLKTENRAVCECVGDELLKYMKSGFSEEEAIAMYDANPNSKYRHLIKEDEDEYTVPF